MYIEKFIFHYKQKSMICVSSLIKKNWTALRHPLFPKINVPPWISKLSPFFVETLYVSLILQHEMNIAYRKQKYNFIAAEKLPNSRKSLKKSKRVT